MKSPTTLVLFAATVFVSTSAMANDWKFLGGGDGGNIQSIYQSPVDPQRLLAFHPLAIYGSSDGGVSWATQGVNGLSGLFNLSFDYAVDSSDEDVIYAASDIGLFRTTDGGETWERVLSGFFASVEYTPSQPPAVFAATLRNGIYKSIDGGTSWARFDSGIDDFEDTRIFADPTIPDTLYAMTAGGLYKTENGGEAWAHSDSGLPEDPRGTFTFDEQSPSNLYNAVGGNVYRSTDGGESWILHLTEIQGNSISGLTVDPNLSTTLYASTYLNSLSGPVFKSNDDGATWVEIADTQDFVTAPFFLTGSVLVFVNITNSADVMIHGRVGLQRNNNGGVGEWLPSHTGLSARDASIFAIDPNNPDTVYASDVDLGGVSMRRSLDAGRSWSMAAMNNITHLSSPTFVQAEPGVIYSVSTTAIHRSVDMGDNWEFIRNPSPGGGGVSLRVAQENPPALYARNFAEGIRYGPNWGESWESKNTGLPVQDCDYCITTFAIDPNNPDILYAGTLYGQIYKTTNGAELWTIASVLQSGNRVSNIMISPTDSQQVYVKEPGTIHRSLDGGVNWEVFLDDGEIEYGLGELVIDPVIPNRLYRRVAGDNRLDAVVISNDSGSTWQMLDGSVPAGGLHVAGDEAQSLYYGTAVGVMAQRLNDDDNDGVANDSDEFPNDPTESSDFDGDGIGDNADPDDDNDGIDDDEDLNPYGLFDDVLIDFWAYSFVESLGRSGITTGCGPSIYCPEDTVTRAQMAVFLERGMNGSNYAPPAATGNVFFDVEAADFAANYIEQLYADGITSGCGTNNYCPDDAVSRAQMAVFLLRSKYGSGYSPPAATGTFGDVPLSYWAAAWIEQLAADGITAGCGDGNYCPDDPVTRAQMAVFLVRTFEL